MLYPVIGSSSKFNLIFVPKIFISIHPTAVGSVDGERKLPMKGLEPKRGRQSRTRSEVRAERREAGSILDGPPEWRLTARWPDFLVEGMGKNRILKPSGRIFSRSTMVVVIAFPARRVPPATWSSSSAVHF